ncbi:MAG TPA: hypothetical protein VF911_05265 [Thermoanaerobaculia bacterium]|jgi:hypothetical protein
MTDHPTNHLTGHLTDGELRAYASLGLKGAALLRVDDHLAACPACERRLKAMPRRTATLLRHIDEAIVEKLASGTLTADEESEVELHASLCAACGARWAFLRHEQAADEQAAHEQAADESERKVVPFPRRASRRPMAVAIAAAIVVLFGLGVLFVPRRPAPRRVAVARATRTETAAPAARVPAPLPPAAAVPLPPAALRTAVLLRDAHGEVTTAGTALTGIPAGSWRRSVEAAVRTQSIAFLSTADLATTPLVLRGAATADGSIVPASPVAAVVESDRPRFRWTAPGASAVRISIYTTDTQRLAQSDWIDSTEWQVPSPLPRGATLVWQVESRPTADDAGTISAPVRFRVLSPKEAARLADARASGSHLVVGTVAAEAGLVDVAVTEFRRLRALNPESPLASALYRQALRAQRAAPTTTNAAQKNG